MLRRLLRSEKGFTLVELMVVVLIIAILVAIAIPVFNFTRERARDRACQANIRTMEGAVHTYEADQDVLPANLAALSPNWVKRIPTCPDDGDAYLYDVATGDVACANGPIGTNPAGDGSDNDHTIQ